MARPLRDQVAGGIYHVFARGNARTALFLDDRDRRTYLGGLAQTMRREGWRCLSYCLMGNHVHLVIETPEPNLARGMQRLHGAYAQWFNRRHGRVGHLFQGRYGSVLVRSDAQLWAAIRYVVLNPVSHGFCRSAAAYPWSSHADVLRGARSPFVHVARLFRYLRAAGGRAHERYAELIGEPRPVPESRAERRQEPVREPNAAATTSIRASSGSAPSSPRSPPR
jgi:putative transposase